MAGPSEQSADTSLDDILSSIRRIVSDDLNGAEELRQRMDTAQAAHSAQTELPHPAEPVSPAESAQQQPTQQTAQPPAYDTQSAVDAPHSVENVESTAALIAAARAAAGTPARDFVASEPRVSQAEVTLPRESLAPFDRGAMADTGVEPPMPPDGIVHADEPTALDGVHTLDAPIVLPTEMEANGHVSAPQTTSDLNGASNGYVEPSIHPIAADPIQESQSDFAPTEPEQQVLESDHVNGSPLNGTHAADPADMQSEHTHCAASMPEDVQPLDLGPPATSTITPDVAAKPQDTSLAQAEPHQAADEQSAAEVPEGASAPTLAQAPTAAHTPVGLSSSVIEQTVSRMLRPMLKEWLDENMPRLIEQALRDDVMSDTNQQG